MKTVVAAVFLLTGTLPAAQMCLTLKPVELPPLGHPTAAQQCVCASMNGGCHWAWVDPSPAGQPAPTPNEPFWQELLRAKIRQKELQQQQQFIQEQNDKTTDLEILKAVHDGLLTPVAPNDDPNLPTVTNSTGQEFRAVVPGAEKPDPGQYFTHGSFNGRKWTTMSDADKNAYVSEYLRNYRSTCFHENANSAQQSACYAKLGNPEFLNPHRPEPIVAGVDRVFATSENQVLPIPTAIRAAGMLASGEGSGTVEEFLESERYSGAEISPPPGSARSAVQPTPSDSDKYFTHGLLNGRMWEEWKASDGPIRLFYVTPFLQGYVVACLNSSTDPAQQKSCSAKLGYPAHVNPVDPHEIVDGVDKVFSVPQNREVIIPVAIQAASMKANGATQVEIDKYLEGERKALAGLPRK